MIGPPLVDPLQSTQTDWKAVGAAAGNAIGSTVAQAAQPAVSQVANLRRKDSQEALFLRVTPVLRRSRPADWQSAKQQAGQPALRWLGLHGRWFA